MLLGVVDFFDLLMVDLAAAVTIEFAECLLDECDSARLHVTSDDTEELVVLDGAVTVAVKGLEELTDVSVSEFQFRFDDSFGELWKIQSTIAVIIHNLEDTADSNNRFGTAQKQFLSESLNQLLSPTDKT